MTEFNHQEMFPLGEDTTAYRLITEDGIATATFNGREITVIQPARHIERGGGR